VLDTIHREGVTGVFLPGPLLTPLLDAVEARPGFAHRLRRMVVFFGTPDLLDRTTRLLGPVWAHGFGSGVQIKEGCAPSDQLAGEILLQTATLPSTSARYEWCSSVTCLRSSAAPRSSGRRCGNGWLQTDHDPGRSHRRVHLRVMSADGGCM
jgi:hypothetical protein